MVRVISTRFVREHACGFCTADLDGEGIGWEKPEVINTPMSQEKPPVVYEEVTTETAESVSAGIDSTEEFPIL